LHGHFRCEHGNTFAAAPLLNPAYSAEPFGSRFALSARVGADPAVLVVARVPLTLFASAGGDARIEHLADDLFVRACSARGERCGPGAHIGAIQIQPNALTQLGIPLLGKAAVRT
jgi:hypothetical protein